MLLDTSTSTNVAPALGRAVVKSALIFYSPPFVITVEVCLLRDAPPPADHVAATVNFTHLLVERFTPLFVNVPFGLRVTTS
jgi:hypothetical protein